MKRRPFSAGASLQIYISMAEYYFCSDLHGSRHRYEMLFQAVLEGSPRAVFLGGDILPGAVTMLATDTAQYDFVEEILAAGMSRLRELMGGLYPEVFIILGNDDGRYEEEALVQGEERGLWRYAHGRVLQLDGYQVYGYSFVPPTPFRLKDWEKYDVSRFVDPGAVHPYQGVRTVPASDYEMRYSTISDDLKEMTEGRDLSRAIMLFHSPPYDTLLDRAALDGVEVDHAPLDVHVGSIAIRRMIMAGQPLVTLHGHVHESAGITGHWMDRLGRTVMMGGAHDGPELALVRFDPERPASASRDLL